MNNYVHGETVCIYLKEGEFNFNMHKQFDRICGETVCICLKEGEFNFINMHKQFHHIRGQTVCNCLKQCDCHCSVVFGYNLKTTNASHPYMYFYFSIKMTVC